MTNWLQALHDWAPRLAVSVLVVAIACLISLAIFHDMPARFISIACALMVAGAAVVALPFLWHARHLYLKDEHQSSFKVEHAVVWRAGETVSFPFVPPTRHGYRIGLLSPSHAELPHPASLFKVECKVEEDGRTMQTASLPPFNSTVGWESWTYALFGDFKASPDKTYRVTLNVQQATDGLSLQQTRLAIMYDYSVRESERSMDTELFSGIGECFLLTACGVFVAGAIRLLPNWQGEWTTP